MNRIETKCVQAGYNPKTGEPRVVPIFQSTTFAYDDCESMAKVFDLESGNHIYTRLSNPTLEIIEERLSALEGGVGAVLTSSGQSAILMAVKNITNSGENIVCSTEIYGGTYNLFDKTLREMGIDVRFFDQSGSDEEIEGLIDEKTRLIYGETLANPSLNIFDIERFAKMAHKYNLPLVIDNTFPTPINCRPFEYGADIVVHSTSKYFDGHACTLGGVVIDSGNFDWKSAGKYPQLTTPDESYHGVIYTENFGNAGYIAKCRAHLLRDMGCQMSPMNGFLLGLGLETLHVRVERHCRNAEKIAEFLANNDKVSWVNYPTLPDNSQNALCKKYLSKGSSGVISFGVKGGKDAAIKFMDNLKLARIVTHVADARTCALHPASTTHRQLNDKQLEECGVKPDLVRLSVGIENVEDIIEDIQNALNIATK